MFKLVPEESGQYTFTSQRKFLIFPYNRLYGTLFEANGSTVIAKSNGSISAPLIAGQTYYLRVDNPFFLSLFLSQDYVLTATIQ